MTERESLPCKCREGREVSHRILDRSGEWTKFVCDVCGQVKFRRRSA